jgi:hypothetical protein
MAKVDITIKVKNDAESFVKQYGSDTPFVMDASSAVLRAMLDETITLFGREVDEVSVKARLIGI